MSNWTTWPWRTNSCRFEASPGGSNLQACGHRPRERHSTSASPNWIVLCPLGTLNSPSPLYPAEGSAYGLVRIDRASAELGFGRIDLQQAVLDPGRGNYHFPLNFVGLDLEKLFARVGVEGLHGSGRLNGSVPIEFVDGQILIEAGELAADRPGILRFSSEAAKKALAGGGEQVALVLQALENFHYDSLTIGLKKPRQGDASAKLSIRGNNPDVLDGYPFAINIDLSGDFESLLKTALEAYRLSDHALRATVQ